MDGISCKLLKLYVLSFLLSVWQVSSAQPALRMRTFSMADGLPSNQISMFAEAPNGMMWIATWNGLGNYDGYHFNSFVSPMGDSQVLTSNRLRFIVPDNDGNVWISNFNYGLYMLSGKEGRYVDYSEKLSKLGVEDFKVSYMHSLDNGAIWVLGENGTNLRVSTDKDKNGDNIIDVVPTSLQTPSLCKMVQSTEDGGEWLISDNAARRLGGGKEIQMRVLHVHHVNNGTLVVGDRLGIYDTQKDLFTEMPLPAGVETIHSSAQLSDKSVAIATNSGVYLFDSKRQGMRKISQLQMTGMEKDSKDRLWSITGNGDVLMLDCKSGHSRTLACGPVNPNWSRVTADRHWIHEDTSGNIWLLLPEKAVCYYDEKDKRLVPMDISKAGGTTYPHTQMNKVYADSRGNLWFTHIFGANMLSFQNKSFSFVPVIQGEEVRALLTYQNGDIWVGTRQGYLMLMDCNGQRLGFLDSNGKITQQQTRFVNKGIYALYEDHKQRVWVGTRGGGLYMMENGKWRHFSANDPNPQSRTCGDDYFDINEDITGRLWFATYETGLMYLEEGAQTSADFHFVSARNSKSLALPEGDIRKIRRISNASDGTLMFATANGLLTMNPRFKRKEDIRIYTSVYKRGDATSLMSHDVLRILPCRNSSNIFVSTMGAGIQTIVSRQLAQNDLEFRSLGSVSGEIGNVMGMIEDKDGKVWIAGEDRLYCFTKDATLQRVFSANDLGGEVEFCETKPCYNPTNNSIVTGAFGGVVIYNPSEIKRSSFTPSIVFSRILYQGDEQATPLVGNHEIVLPVEKHNAMIFFSALDYSDNSKIRYAYRIKELDEKWSYVGEEHCAPLSNMPPGHYILEVRSTDCDGLWTDNNVEQKIYVEPTFWQTPWAWMLYVLLGATLLYGIVYLFQLRNANKMEREMKEKQLRFFTDISHQLRTPLTLIDGPVKQVLSTERLTETARNYLQFVESNANKMLGLVNKSLDLKKLQGLNEEMSETMEVSGVSGDLGEPRRFEDSSLTILIVEDNDELRYFLNTSLSVHYNIIEAENGKVGLKRAAECNPDFIITDIMMPEMDGITMIRHIKQDPDICHIPIIILSARTADIYRIEGLKEGADDYITKPFSVSYLQVRVESIVRQRKMLQDAWRDSLMAENSSSSEATSIKELTTEDVLTPIDQRFIEDLTKFVNDNIANENMKIDDIADGLALSRSVLYSKVKAIYGTTPNDIVRNIRINKACQMLKNDTNKNISEIAFAVGFSDPKYFARVFKQECGVSPSEYKRNK